MSRRISRPLRSALSGLGAMLAVASVSATVLDRLPGHAQAATMNETVGSIAKPRTAVQPDSQDGGTQDASSSARAAGASFGGAIGPGDGIG